MKFQPGQSGNPKGRPRTPSKSNTELRQMIRKFVSGLLDPDEMYQDFIKLKPEMKFKVRIELSKMLLPDPISLQKLSPEDMEELFTYIKSELNEKL